MNHKQNGFTLIELVVVISIIAILAAIAMPRFINLQTQARIAKLNGVLGSVKSASALAHAGCLVDLAGLTTPSTCTVAAGTVSMEGTAVTMVSEYPAATAAGIAAAAQIVSGQDGIFVTVANPMFIDLGTAANPTCRISYTQATAGPPITAPLITLVSTAGC
ncbi:MAG: prepilin-type N-terminal cleavage/methylation domain-containing protein [Burkholderiales bacterium]